MGKIRPTSSGAVPLPYRELKRHAQMESVAAQRGINALRGKRWDKDHEVEVLKRPTKEAKHTNKIALKALSKKLK